MIIIGNSKRNVRQMDERKINSFTFLKIYLVVVVVVVRNLSFKYKRVLSYIRAIVVVVFVCLLHLVSILSTLVCL